MSTEDERQLAQTIVAAAMMEGYDYEAACGIARDIINAERRAVRRRQRYDFTLAVACSRTAQRACAEMN